MDKQIVLNMINRGEKRDTEFKVSKSCLLKNLFEIICAFLNRLCNIPIIKNVPDEIMLTEQADKQINVIIRIIQRMAYNENRYTYIISGID